MGRAPERAYDHVIQVNSYPHFVSCLSFPGLFKAAVVIVLMLFIFMVMTRKIFL